MKGVFDIMKTNKSTKMIFALLAVLTIFCLTAAAFAQSEAESSGENAQTGAEAADQQAAEPEKGGKKDGKNHPGRRTKDDDRFEDWFEDRIEALEHGADFSELPEDPTDEELLDFFKKYFTGTETTGTETDKSAKKDPAAREGRSSREGQPEHGRKKGHGSDSDPSAADTNGNGTRPSRRMKHDDDRADWFEDWFENRIEEYKNGVDFSELPENPTDEEMLEFFRKYFMGKEAA